jgi:hypothetical protein
MIDLNRDDFVLTLDLGPCEALAPISDQDGMPITCRMERFHKGSHYGPVDSFPDQAESQVKWDDTIVLQRNAERELWVECSCGWTFGPGEALIKLGNAAVQHARETDHILRGADDA